MQGDGEEREEHRSGGLFAAVGDDGRKLLGAVLQAGEDNGFFGADGVFDLLVKAIDSAGVAKIKTSAVYHAVSTIHNFSPFKLVELITLGRGHIP